jgi:DNA-binding transcriptional ArsR family regulator
MPPNAALVKHISISLCNIMPASEIFRALADPTRRAVFERLAQGEMSVSALKAGFAISQPAISQHLAALRGAGLVAERREGRFAYYRVDPAGLAPLVDWIELYRGFWPERIEALRSLLKQTED